VHPHATHSKLQLDYEGLAALRSITAPVAPVVVIGPYRSGKSFLLNQLLQVACGA
jgi:ABC-type polar amino acid transport system ATPase subunit